jgi:hypothetical protein
VGSLMFGLAEGVRCGVSFQLHHMNCLSVVNAAGSRHDSPDSISTPLTLSLGAGVTDAAAPSGAVGRETNRLRLLATRMLNVRSVVGFKFPRMQPQPPGTQVAQQSWVEGAAAGTSPELCGSTFRARRRRAFWFAFHLTMCGSSRPGPPIAEQRGWRGGCDRRDQRVLRDRRALASRSSPRAA